MLRRALLLTIVATLLIATPTDSALALRKKGANCSKYLGYCKGVVLVKGRIKLTLASLSHGGEYELCVRPPHGKRECKSFKLALRPPGVFFSSVDFARNFSSEQKGRYVVAWYQVIPLGAAMHFSKE